jgi:hypothetical protein
MAIMIIMGYCMEYELKYSLENGLLYSIKYSLENGYAIVLSTINIYKP